jgi:hypothetical protein
MVAKRKRSHARPKWSEGYPAPAFGKLYRPLGLAAVTFADLEQMLTMALAELLHRPFEEAMAIEWLMQSLTNRIQLFYFLANEATRKLIEKHAANKKRKAAYESLGNAASDIYGALMQAQTDRNNLMHSPWSGIGTSGERSYSKYRWAANAGKLTEIPIRGVTPTILAAQAKYFVSLQIRLWDWTMRVTRGSGPDDWPAPLHKRYFLHSPLHSLILANKNKAQKRQP